MADAAVRLLDWLLDGWSGGCVIGAVGAAFVAGDASLLWLVPLLIGPREIADRLRAERERK